MTRAEWIILAWLAVYFCLGAYAGHVVTNIAWRRRRSRTIREATERVTIEQGEQP